jgi:hypothetical protein
MTPEARVGNTANVVIFLGILYTVLAVVVLLRGAETAAYSLLTLGMSLAVIGLGYGIRYGSMVCLYLTTGLFGLFICYFGYITGMFKTLRPALRLALSCWALLGLCRSIPAMRILHQTDSKPSSSSRYGDFFLRRKTKEPS